MAGLIIENLSEYVSLPYFFGICKSVAHVTCHMIVLSTYAEGHINAKINAKKKTHNGFDQTSEASG